MKYDLSIVMAVFNSQDTALRLSNEIVSQASKSQLPIQLIIVDDGSDSGRDERFDTIGADLETVCVEYYYLEHRGVGATKNSGLKKATSRYVTFVDSDDEIEPHFLDNLFENFSSTDAEVYVYGYQSERVGPNISTRIAHSLPRYGLVNAKTAVKDFYLLENQPVGGYLFNKVFLRSFVGSRLMPEGVVYEDTPFVFELLTTAQRVAYCQGENYYYRFTETSIVHAPSKQKLLDKLKMLDKIIQIGAEHEGVANRIDANVFISRALLSIQSDNELYVKSDEVSMLLIKKFDGIFLTTNLIQQLGMKHAMKLAISKNKVAHHLIKSLYQLKSLMGK